VRRAIQSLRVLITRELRHAAPQVALVMLVVVTLSGGVSVAFSQTPLLHDPEVGSFLFQLISIATVVLAVIFLARYQTEDFQAGRLRHLLGFPVSPLQIVVAKIVAFAVGALAALAAMNCSWSLLCPAAGPWRELGFLARTTGDQWLVLLLIWSGVMLARRLEKVGLGLILLWIIATRLDPVNVSRLMLPFESGPDSMATIRLAALIASTALLTVLERHLATRPVI